MRPFIALLVLCLGCRPYMPQRSHIDAITAAAGSVGEEYHVIPSVRDVDWLGGCWTGQMGPAVVEEYWSTPRAGTMLGMSRTIRRDSTVGYEVMLISLRDRRLTLDATPHQQGTTSFVAGATGPTSLTFENLAHDFPQRISYRLLPPDSLTATVSAHTAADQRAVVIAMVRMACPDRRPR